MKDLLQRIAECKSCARRRKLMREYLERMGKRVAKTRPKPRK